jgi:hypothetical protein
MPPWRALGLLLLGVTTAAGQGGGLAFAPDLPAGVGDVAGWQVITGSFETAAAEGAYRLYVGPRHQAIYRLMRYEVRLLSPATEVARRRMPGERVAFIRHVGEREPMVFWQRQAEGIRPAWREIPVESAEYRLEIEVLLGVLAVHRAARETAPEPVR